MRTAAILSQLISITILAASCTVISQPIRSDSEPQVPFGILLQDVEKYTGRTVILGGYILETNNLEAETVLKVLQVPLRIGEEPAPKDRSEGRFIVYHKGFLDPEVYSKDRAITVAGRVMAATVEKIGDDQIRYLQIENREIYLWPEYQTLPPTYWPYPYPHLYPYPYLYRDPYFYPYPYYYRYRR